MTDAPRIGHVLRYPYLWARQALSGETEGRKTRPCAVVLAITNQVGNTELRLCAITTQPPSSSNRAISVPEIERRRAGLDTGIGQTSAETSPHIMGGKGEPELCGVECRVEPTSHDDA